MERARENQPPGRVRHTYLAAAADTARWLRSVEIPTENGLTWPVAPEQGDRTAADLYYGSAGVILFFLELAAASGDPVYLVDARGGADHLLAELPGELERLDAGLYTGVAGIGFALHEVGKATREESYLAGTRRCLHGLRETAQPAGAGVEWSPVIDLIGGSAGIGLLLLYAARQLREPESLQLAAAAGRRLLERAEPAENGLSWRRSPEAPTLLPNFSHGTAGVAYFLASLHLETGDQEYLDAAVQAGRHLLTIAHTEGGGCLIPHHLPGGEDLYYLGWCHGPAGTARLFYRLYQATGDSNWLEWLDRCLQSIARSGIPEHSRPGYWNNVGMCCGAAGVADFLLGIERVRGRSRYQSVVEGFTRHILERATRTADGLKWLHSEHRSKPELLQAQTGLMQGAAGVGLLLLWLDAMVRGRDRTIVLPDSPF